MSRNTKCSFCGKPKGLPWTTRNFWRAAKVSFRVDSDDYFCNRDCAIRWCATYLAALLPDKSISREEDLTKEGE